MPGLNYLRNVIRHPCATPSPKIIIESAVRALVPAVVSYAAVDCIDLMRFLNKKRLQENPAAVGGNPRSNPKQPKGGHRSLKGSKGTRAGSIAADGAYWSSWELIGLARQVGAFWFAYSVGRDFVINWTSMMYAEQGCDLPPDSYAEGGLGPWDYATTDDTQYGVFSSGPSGSHCFAVGFDWITLQPGCEANVSYSCQWMPLEPDKPGFVETRLTDNDQRFSSWSRYDPSQMPKSPTTMGGIAKLSGGTGLGRKVQIEVHNPSSLHRMTSGSWQITTSGAGIPLFPLDTCGGPTTIWNAIQGQVGLS